MSNMFCDDNDNADEGRMIVEGPRSEAYPLINLGPNFEVNKVSERSRKHRSEGDDVVDISRIAPPKKTGWERRRRNHCKSLSASISFSFHFLMTVKLYVRPPHRQSSEPYLLHTSHGCESWFNCFAIILNLTLHSLVHAVAFNI